MAPQDMLSRLLDDRLNACERGLVGGGQSADDADRDLMAIVVLAGFDPVVFLRGALEFTLGLPAETGSAWLRAYTRTIFLVGNPVNLGRRFTFRHVSADGRMAWTEPGSPEQHTGLRRLLRAFTGTTPVDLPDRLQVDVPGAPPTGSSYDLFTPTARTIERYLVDVHHTVAEAALRGMLGPGDHLRLRHVRSLSRLPARPEYARVMPDADDPGRLRPLTWLVRGEVAA